MTNINYSHLKLQVWRKGRIIPGYNAAVWRRDQCGAAIKYDEYGNRNSKHGWEIHHVIPDSDGGSERIENLMPLQWENNTATSDSRRLSCKVRR